MERSTVILLTLALDCRGDLPTRMQNARVLRGRLQKSRARTVKALAAHMQPDVRVNTALCRVNLDWDQVLELAGGRHE